MLDGTLPRYVNLALMLAAKHANALMHRIRSSHHIAARPFANFGIEVQWQLIDSSVAFEFEVPERMCRNVIGTSNSPHWHPTQDFPE
jgi:hypothetical protein